MGTLGRVAHRSVGHGFSDHRAELLCLPEQRGRGFGHAWWHPLHRLERARAGPVGPQTRTPGPVGVGRARGRRAGVGRYGTGSGTPSSIGVRRRVVPSAGSQPMRASDALPDAGHQSCEPAPATDPRLRSGAYFPQYRCPLRRRQQPRRSGQPAGGPIAPPTTAAPPEAIPRPALASTPEPAPPRCSRPARPQSPAETPTTRHPAPGVNWIQGASAGRPWPGARDRPRTAATTTR